MNAPILAGDLVTATPTDFKDSILACAPPLPPEIIAPAWPILRPGGAVSPAINETTGFELGPELCAFRYSAACSSALPPISPINIIPKEIEIKIYLLEEYQVTSNTKLEETIDEY